MPILHPRPAGLLRLLVTSLAMLPLSAADTVTINAGSALADVSHHPIGINLDYLMDDDSRLKTAPVRSTRDALAAMGVKYLRYPGGEKSQNFLWSASPWTAASTRASLPGVWPTTDSTCYASDKTTARSTTLDFDEFMTMATSLGAKPVIVVNSDSQYVTGGPTRETLLQTAENWVRYANVVKGYGIKYWMIGNETWNTGNYAGHTTAANHKADVIAFSQRMKAVDPSIKIIACGNGTNASWNSTVLGGSNVFDGLTINGYFNPGTSYATYQNNNSTYQNVSSIVPQIDTYSQPGDGSRIRPCYYEWNGIDWSNSWANTNDIGHALLNFQIQGDMLVRPGWDFSCLWNTRWIGADPGSVNNALKADGTFTAVGQSLAIWGNNLLDTMVSSTSSTSYLRPYACTKKADGTMNAFIINKDTVARATSISLSAYPAQATVGCWQMIGTTNTDQAPTWAQKANLAMSGSTVTATLPALSITMLRFAPATALTVPTIAALSPTTGPALGGTPVTLTGTNLTGTTAVTFGGTPATSVTVVNATTLTCIAPPHSAGEVEILVTATGGSARQATGFTYAPLTSNVAPTVAVAAVCAPSPVLGKTATLTTLGADADGGEGNLSYTWATTGTVPAGVSFSPNGTNAAKTATATFAKIGTYSLQVTIKDVGGLKTTSTVTVSVSPTLTSIAMTPSSATLRDGISEQFFATARDQFAYALASQPAITWSLASGIGSVDATGRYTAPASGTGTGTVQATAGTIIGKSVVTVTASGDLAPKVATAAACAPNPVTGTTAALSVLGTDDGGEAALTYTWATTGTPPAPVTYSVNGTNAAKTTVATFTKPGTYALQATLKDSAGQTVASSVSVTVKATLTSVVVTPATVSLGNSATQQFAASGKDQFGVAMTTQPSFAWSVPTGGAGGTVTSAGLYTAPATGTGTSTVRATGSGISGTATVTVTTIAAKSVIPTAPATSQADSANGRDGGCGVGGGLAMASLALLGLGLRRRR